MSLTAWNETIPNDNNLAGEGDDEIVSLKARVKERLELDHHFAGELDPLEGDCDGYHKKVTLQKLSADPTPLTGTGMLYTKEVDGIIELFFVDEVSGVVNQLTEQGVLSLNTLQNDIDGNNKIISNVIINNLYENLVSKVHTAHQLGSVSNSNHSAASTVIKYYTLTIKRPCVFTFTGYGTGVHGAKSANYELGQDKSGTNILPQKGTLNYKDFTDLVGTDITESTNFYLPVGKYYFKLTISAQRSLTSGTCGVSADLKTLKVLDDSLDRDDNYTLTEGW